MKKGDQVGMNVCVGAYKIKIFYLFIDDGRIAPRLESSGNLSA